jgi:Family of unknown function (DUF5367)
MRLRLFFYGLAIWMAGTLALRLSGHRFLHPGNWPATLLLFAVSFPVTAWLVRRLCSRYPLRREEWPAGAVAVLLPTLLLDPFSSAFFPVVFPNLAPESAGVFGGWMLWCCAGALVGVTVRWPKHA